MKLTDEQRVVLYLTCRELSGGGKSYTYHKTIEEGCWAFWQAAGCHRSRDTWVRACRRAREARLLGPVREHRPSGKRWTEFTYSASLTDLLRAIGPDWPGIAHGKGKEQAQKPTTTPGNPAGANSGDRTTKSTSEADRLSETFLEILEKNMLKWAGVQRWMSKKKG